MSGGAESKRLLVSDHDHQVSVSHRVTRISPPPTASTPKADSPNTGNQWASTFVDGERELYAEIVVSSDSHLEIGRVVI